MTTGDDDHGDRYDRKDREDACKSRPTLTSCAVGQLGEQLFERVSTVGVVKALVHGLQSQSKEHGGQRKIALGVAHQRVETVVVVQQTGHVPAEPVQYVPESLADQLVRTHHPG